MNSAEERMQSKLWRNIITYAQACQILHRYGERAWPWNVPYVWKLAKYDVDQEWPLRP